jgi:hypothetical protein
MAATPYAMPWTAPMKGAHVGPSAHARRERQIGAGLAVLPVGDHCRKVAGADPQDALAIEVRQRVRLPAGQALDAGDQGVEAGIDGGLGRHRERQLRVVDDDLRQQVGAVHDAVLMCALVDLKDGGRPRVRPGDVGGGHDDLGQPRARDEAVTEHLTYRHVIGRRDRHALGDVHRTAAPEADDQIAAGGTQQLDGFVDQPDGCVRDDAAVDHERGAGLFERADRRRHVSTIHHRLFGDDQRFGAAQPRDLGGQAGAGAEAEHEPARRLELKRAKR